MMDKTNTAGRTPGPLKVVEKKGTQPNCACNQLQAGRIMGMITNNPHKP